MTEFTIEIAGHRFGVRANFASTRDYCRAYLTEEALEHSITVTEADIRFEQEALDKEAREEGFRRRKFTDPFLERAAIQRQAAEWLFDRDVLLIHGSALAMDGQGYLFTAKSGTGKSTHTRLWREAFGERVVMVNDDKPFLRLADNGVLLCGAPWSGKHGLDANVTVPLKGICILHRGTENKIHPCPADEAEAMLWWQGYQPLDAAKQPQFHEKIARLMALVPVWRMECTKDAQAALAARQTLSQ